MGDFDIKAAVAMAKVIADEKGLSEEQVYEIISAAIAAAWRKDHGERDMDVRADVNWNTGEADVYIMRTVVEDNYDEIERTDEETGEPYFATFNPNTMIRLKDAGKKKLGDIIEEKHKVEEFGRVASQVAKQVIIQRLRDAEQEFVLATFEDKIGEVMTGTVLRADPRVVRIEIGKVVAIMPKFEQIDNERYYVGMRLKVFIKEIERNERGAQLIVSRGNTEFIEYLFRQEVPELENNTVEIMNIVREAGRRTKIAVKSNIPGIDPVGAFVGGRGVRVQAIQNEIGDREKIDVIVYSDNPSEYIREAISPAEVQKIEIKDKTAQVFVTPDQQPIAIGKMGQNVRLASKLTGYELDIRVAEETKKKVLKSSDVENSLLSALEEGTEE